jgi:periplasmic divalent cation tolerance protein
LAKLALEEHLVACANVIPGVESHYWWQDKLEQSAEVLVIFKTLEPNTERLERVIQEHHPYDTPEFVVLALDSGSERYLAWLRKEASGVSE